MFVNKLRLFQNLLVLSAVTLIIVVWSMVVFISHQNKQLSEQTKKISSYEECVKAGNIILESYPAVCVTKDGRRFVQQIINNNINYNYWKTYTNEKHGLSFKYPNDWILKEYSPESVCISPFGCATEKDLSFLDIYPGLVSIGLGATSKVEKPTFSTKIGADNLINANKTETYTHTNNPNPHYNNKHIIIYVYEIKDGWTNEIKFISDVNKGEDKYIVTFEQILSTLRFDSGL